MSNAERIIETRRQEYGYNEFEENAFEIRQVAVKLHGKLIVFKPRKEE